MSLSNTKMDTDAEALTDKVASAGGVLPSGIYPMQIKVAFVSIGATGSTNIVLHAESPDGQFFKTSECVISGDAKGNHPYYIYSGKKIPLMGWANMQQLCQLTLNKELSEMETEEKTIKLYDYESKKELPKEVDMITDLIGEAVYMAIREVRSIKQVQLESGAWVDTEGEDLEIVSKNEIDKVYDIESKLTVIERDAGETEHAKYDNWEKVNKDKVKYKKGVKDLEKNGAKAAGTAGSPATTTQKKMFS